MRRNQLAVWFVVCGLILLSRSKADPAPTTVPATTWPIRIEHITRKGPNESICRATIDLTDPRVSLHVDRGGPKPDGPGQWSTTLLPTRDIADRDGWDLAVNGDLFEADRTREGPRRNGNYLKGEPARPLGPAATDGVQWATNSTTRPALEITADRRVRIVSIDATTKLPADVRDAIAGSHIIVQGGKRLEYKTRFATDRNPRTAVGIDRDGTHLILLVVDGRQPNRSVGMTLAELADEMIAAGAETALNLDGGGSSTLIAKDRETGKLTVENNPSNAGERSVADALGVAVRP